MTGSTRALGNSIRPIGKGAYGKLSECGRWCPDRKSPGTALFFDDPENNQGFFYYRTLKIFRKRTDLQPTTARPKEGFASGGCSNIWDFPSY
nr:hypothetical protein [Muricauda sp. UBA7809]